MSPCQARSEVLGGRKRGAKVVIDDSDDLPADEVSMDADVLEVELTIFSGGVRARVLLGGKTSR